MAVNTHSWMSAPSNADDAAMRKWIQGIHDSFVAAGLAQSDDTGQIDIATAPSAGATTGATIGYEIWGFDDEWQDTCPILIKIEYMHTYAAVGVGRPGIALTVGTESDGAGALVGNVLVARTTFGSTSSSSSASSSSEFASYASGDGSSISVILWPSWSASNTLGGFTVERSCASEGNYTGAAIAVSVYDRNRSTTVIGCHGTANAAQYAQWGALPVMLPSNVNGVILTTPANLINATLSEDGTTAPVFPIPYAAPGVSPWVSNSLVAITPGDAGATSVIQVATINGQERTYRAFPYSPGSSTAAGGLIQAAANAATAFPAIAWKV